MKQNHTALSVNVNKVALLRNTRPLGIPSVLRASKMCLESGAHGITVHPRPDERHIRTKDVYELSEMLQDWPTAEFNIEGNPFHNLMQLIREVQPQQATFVPDSVDQKTSDHGWHLSDNTDRLAGFIRECNDLGVRVSLFMDPIGADIAKAKELGADRVELYTESWATAFATTAHATTLGRFADSAAAAHDAGLGVNAGHDLNLANLTPFLDSVPHIVEVSIGHAFIADALELGYAATVRAYLNCIDQSRPVR